MGQTVGHRARQLLEDTRKAIATTEERIRRHPYLEALETKVVKKGKLTLFAGQQCHIIESDLRSVALDLVPGGVAARAGLSRRNAARGGSRANPACGPLAARVRVAVLGHDVGGRQRLTRARSPMAGFEEEVIGSDCPTPREAPASRAVPLPLHAEDAEEAGQVGRRQPEDLRRAHLAPPRLGDRPPDHRPLVLPHGFVEPLPLDVGR